MKKQALIVASFAVLGSGTALAGPQGATPQHVEARQKTEHSTKTSTVKGAASCPEQSVQVQPGMTKKVTITTTKTTRAIEPKPAPATQRSAVTPAEPAPASEPSAVTPAEPAPASEPSAVTREEQRSEVVEEEQLSEVVEAEPAAAPEPKEVVVVQPPEDVGTVELYFDTASAMLEREDMDDLEKLAQWAANNPTGAIQLEGHTDPRGSVEANVDLAADRAATVRQQLIDLGVSPDQILVTIYGEAGPRRDTYAEDRRVTAAATTALRDSDETAD